MDSLVKTKDTAAQWIARRGGEDWGATDQAEFEQWLEASTGNRIAFLRLEAVWREANRLKVLGAGAKPGVVPTLEDWRTSPFFKHIPKSEAETAQPFAPLHDRAGAPKGAGIKFAVAAGVLLAIGAASYFAWNLLGGDRYSTPIGVTAAVPLSDGSKVTLNTASKISVAVTSTERRVNLEQGEAFFEVAKDPARPFVVRAGDKRVIAVGTKFSVRREADDVRVIVTEGKVRFEDVRRSTPLLVAGNIVSTHNDKLTIQARSLPQAEELLSWRNGYLVFHETALTDAVAEFNRYNTRKFTIEDPGLERILVSGNFRSTNVEPFARLLEQGFPVTVDRQDDRIVLKRSPIIFPKPGGI